MLQKIKITSIHFIKRLSDVRFSGQVIFVIIVLLVSWSTVKAIQSNYDVQKQVVAKQKENEIQELKNNNLKIKNQYLETDEYLELAAREQLGKAGSGETVVIIPKDVAMKHTVESSIQSSEQEKKKVDDSKPTYQKNLESWGRFFFHH